VKLNRREFGQGAAGALALLAIGGTSLSLEGCSASEIESGINAVINGADSVLKVAEPNASWLAPFESAIAALKTAEATWVKGGVVTLVEEALNTLAAIAAVIPFTAVYSPLIDVLVAAIDAVLSLIPQPSVTANAMAAVPNPHRGRVKLASRSLLHPTLGGAIKHQWNGVCATSPALAAAAIK